MLWTASLISSQNSGYLELDDAFESCKSSPFPAPATRYPYNLRCKGIFLGRLVICSGLHHRYYRQAA